MLFMRVLRRLRLRLAFRSCLRGSRPTHGRLNPVIGEAAAEHRRHRFANLRVGRARIPLEQRDGCQHLAVLAIAARGHLLVDPCLLDRDGARRCARAPRAW